MDKYKALELYIEQKIKSREERLNHTYKNGKKHTKRELCDIEALIALTDIREFIEDMNMDGLVKTIESYGVKMSEIQ